MATTKNLTINLPTQEQDFSKYLTPSLFKFNET